MNYAFIQAIKTCTYTPQSRLFPTKSANNEHYAMKLLSHCCHTKGLITYRAGYTTAKSIKRLESVSDFAITRFTLTCCVKNTVEFEITYIRVRVMALWAKPNQQNPSINVILKRAPHSSERVQKYNHLEVL